MLKKRIVHLQFYLVHLFILFRCVCFCFVVWSAGFCVCDFRLRGFVSPL